MKRVTTLTITLAAGLIACLVLVIAWAERGRPASVAARSNKPSTDWIAGLDHSPGGSLVDQTIARTAAAVRRDQSNAILWTALGAALMQKARETADASYNNQAERAYQQALSINPNSAPAMTGMAWVNGS